MNLRPFALVLLLLASMSAPAVLSVQGSTPVPPRPTVSFNLCARIAAPAGWGFTCPTVTQPGPTLTVQQGDTVDLSLLAGDTITHQWVLDVDGDGNPGGGEPASPFFTSNTNPVPYSFTVMLLPGTYQYICGVHGIAQSGSFVVTGPTRPTVTLTNPGGALNRWTGGSVQRLTWDLTDPDGLPSALRVYLNYTSATAGNGVIAGPPTLPLGATSYDWTVPMIDAADVHVVATVIDPNSEVGTDDKTIPVIDSTRPTVDTTSPGPSATDVDVAAPILVNFSEAMNRPATEAAFSIAPNPGGISFSWSNGDRTMTVSHAPFQAATTYTPLIGIGARDTSLPGNTLAGPYSWSFATRNAPPTVALSAPNGGERWTGPSFHDVTWTMSDPDTPGNLVVDIHYSTDGGATYPNAILTSASLSQGPQTYSWTVPATDSGTVRVRVCASDGNSQMCAASAADLAIDATPPNVLSTNPDAGATNVPIGASLMITFSEPMNETVTGHPAVVSLEESPAGTWVPLSYSWAGAVLTVDPLVTLQPFTQYVIHVNASAQDASDPGNSMGGAVASLFTTGTADAVPPTITGLTVTPPSQVEGGSVEIAATVTDNSGTVATVSANVTLPDTTTVNLTMTPTGTRWSVSSTWTQVGDYAFVLWAVDPSGNAASAPGTFTITAADTTAPTITHTPPTGPFYAGDHIDIHATVTDAGGILEVRLIYTVDGGAEQNVSMVLDAGEWHYEVYMPSPGTLEYRIYAVDDAGNAAETPRYTAEVSAAPPPPADLTIPIAIGLVLVLAAVLAAVVLLRRRKRPGDGETPKDPGSVP